MVVVLHTVLVTYCHNKSQNVPRISRVQGDTTQWVTPRRWYLRMISNLGAAVWAWSPVSSWTRWDAKGNDVKKKNCNQSWKAKKILGMSHLHIFTSPKPTTAFPLFDTSMASPFLKSRLHGVTVDLLVGAPQAAPGFLSLKAKSNYRKLQKKRAQYMIRKASCFIMGWSGWIGCFLLFSVNGGTMWLLPSTVEKTQVESIGGLLWYAAPQDFSQGWSFWNIKRDWPGVRTSSYPLDHRCFSNPVGATWHYHHCPCGQSSASEVGWTFKNVL